MKTHSSNYYNSFIAIAEDCNKTTGTIPPDNGKKKTIANLQFELIKDNPYQYSSDEVLFQCYASKNAIAEGDMEAARTLFFSKGQPCMRCSPLTKSYGWGVHSNAEGKIALFGVETKEYQAFLDNSALEIKKAMRSSKK